MLLLNYLKLDYYLEEELKKLLKGNKVIPFVGAGVSLSVKSKVDTMKMFLTWKELLLKLSDYLEKYDKKDEADLIRLSLKVKKNNYLQIAGDLKDFFPSNQLFYKSLKEIFDKKSEEIEISSLSLAKSIWTLNQKLIITTNYDKVLHWASDSPNDTNRWDIQSIYEQADSLGNEVKNQTVWHLHGHIENVKNLIFTEDSYKELYNTENNSKFKVAYNTLRHYLMSKSFLFIGYSLDDEYFVNELINICNIFDSQSSLHYILIENGKSLPQELEKKIIPIYYEEKGKKLIEKIKFLSHDNNILESNEYIEEVKEDIIDESYLKSLPFCINNLPTEEYNLDGGFVGRKNEILKLQNLIYSNQDRIITITGAGGLGKTSIALKCAYTFLNDFNNPFIYIIWFSAKEDKLTSENGIVQISSQISDYSLLLKDILNLLDENTCRTFKENNITNEIFKDAIYKVFLQKRSLLIIDNLETISNRDIIDFIKDIPRPSQVLITSRKGLGEVERRQPLLDFPLEDSIELFKIISKERNRFDLLKLSNDAIIEKVKKVRSYPLLIKWSIGKICLGMDIDKAFNQIYSGKSEISQFVFNDIFNLISNNSRKCLFSMIIFGEKPISKHLMQHISSLNSDDIEDSIKELIITSFIFSEIVESNKESTSTYYSMLSLTRGFIKHKLDSNEMLKNELISKYRELSLQIENSQKSKDSFEQSLLEFGIKTEEDKIAFNYVKTAKNYLTVVNDIIEAKKYFDSALSIAPNLPYVLSEFGKFEASMGHNFEAEKYFLEACHLNDKNFHTHFAYGVFLRKINNVKKAIIHLKKAKELNPKYLPIYNELGRSLSFNGEYEEANKNFIVSLDQKDEFINYRHLNITLYYKSDNYKRWANELFIRKDYDKGKEKLFRSLDIIEKANENYKFDIKNQILEKRISQDIGKIMLTLNEYEIGKKYLLKSTEKIKSDSILCKDDNDFIFSSFTELINHIINEKINEPDLKYYIQEAEKYSSNQKSKNKLESLKDRIYKKNIKEGVIRFFNFEKEFGVIDSLEGKSYTFLLDNLMTSLPQEDLYKLESKKVTFKENPNSYGKNFAKSIQII